MVRHTLACISRIVGSILSFVAATLELPSVDEDLVDLERPLGEQIERAAHGAFDHGYGRQPTGVHAAAS